MEQAILDEFPAHRACRNGDIQTLSSILNFNSSLIFVEDHLRKWLPVHWASYYGHLDCVRCIVSVEPSAIQAQTSSNFLAPLHCAAEGGHAITLLWLLQAGAYTDMKDSAGETALHKACRTGNTECVKILVSAKANISSQNALGQSAIAVAELSGHTALAECVRRMALVDFGVCGRPYVQHPFGRKRARDTVCDDAPFKRIRSEDFSLEDFNTTEDMMTSVVDHENMCNIEMGYSNSLLRCIMFNEFHGC